MKIKEIGFFHTPESWDELMTWIKRHSKEDQASLITAASMSWNLASKTQREIET